MKNVTIIDFKDFNSLKTRDAVRNAFANIQDPNIIWVDFKNIEFLSRTAAHELLKIKESASSLNIDISFINIGDQVNKMFDVVEKSYSKSKNADFRFVKWLSFKNDEQYKDYLLNIQ